MDALTHHPLNSLRLHRTDDLEGCHTKSPCFSLEGLILPQASSRGTPSIVLLAVSIRVLLTGSTFFFVAPARLAFGSDRDMLAACIPPILRRAGWILPPVGPRKVAGWLAERPASCEPVVRLTLLVYRGAWIYRLVTGGLAKTATPKQKKEEKARLVDATGAGDRHGRRQHMLHMLEGMRRGGIPWQMVHV